jgi:hypothetical protein
MRIISAKLSREDLGGNREGMVVARLDRADLREIESLLVKELKVGMRNVHAIRFLLELYDQVEGGLESLRDMKSSADLRRDPATQYRNWRVR